MTPVALLAVFCAVMAAIAIGRLVVDEQPEYVDIGTTFVVVGITVLATLWVFLEERLLSPVGWLLLAVVGGCAIVVGVAVIALYWE
ncbi:hypothetical protein [Natronorubrum sulfidifaciens]|uniref:Drug resistance transporter, Bcr/CflA subfamily protein n=1 Tax=Natronorubrum sulfidifaciens JCM 14089 TaxID=1230460 RepID=L9WE75_9EURY|nr:hypothetical protein [Natronorubrum sulfidifaciens]ELY47652.1 hypothetical protein C495_05322 [Natronorubrum sulfidifaciens JCM 14089]